VGLASGVCIHDPRFREVIGRLMKRMIPMQSARAHIRQSASQRFFAVSEYFLILCVFFLTAASADRRAMLLTQIYMFATLIRTVD
jgi:hypothetical protein